MEVSSSNLSEVPTAVDTILVLSTEEPPELLDNDAVLFPEVHKVWQFGIVPSGNQVYDRPVPNIPQNLHYSRM